jgi:hypothetical protein
MDEHQRDELCRRVAGNASHEGIRSRDFLHDV